MKPRVQSTYRSRRRVSIPWALAALLALGGAADATRVLPEVDLLRLEGHVREPRPEDRGTTDLTLGWHRKQVRFQLTDLKVMNGRRLPGDVLSAVSLYRPNIFLYGAEAMMKRLDEAKPDEIVKILGYFRIASRSLMVNEVSIEGLPTPSPAAHGARARGQTVAPRRRALVGGGSRCPR